jgi:hypothetical protein
VLHEDAFVEGPFALALGFWMSQSVGAVKVKLACQQPFFGIYKLSNKDVESELSRDEDKYQKLVKNEF